MTISNPAVAMFAWFAAGLLTGLFAALPLVLEKEAPVRADRRGEVTVAAAATRSRGS